MYVDPMPWRRTLFNKSSWESLVLVFLLVMVVAEALVVRVGFRRRGDLAPRCNWTCRLKPPKINPNLGLVWMRLVQKGAGSHFALKSSPSRWNLELLERDLN